MFKIYIIIKTCTRLGPQVFCTEVNFVHHSVCFH